MTPHAHSGRFRLLAAGLVLGLTALTGCSSAVKEEQAQSTSATPQDGGVLRLGVPTDLSQCTTSSSYAGRPMSSTSSASLET
jgi:hypothetical protein